MDPNIRNFSQIEKLIKENPRQADAQAFEWERFLKTNASMSPELYSIETAEEFYNWVQEHPEKNIDPSVWVGKEISDSYYYLREQHEQEQMQKEGAVNLSSIPQELSALPILAASFLDRPKIMQDDKDYQKIEERLKKEWLEKNPGKDFSSKEGIDYLHGSLEDPSKQSLTKEAEASFRSNPKFKKRIERYGKEGKKIYKNPKDDPSFRMHEYKTEEHLNARLEYLKTHESEKSGEEITKIIKKRSQEEFAARYPEKTKAYSEKVEGLRKTQEESQIKEALSSYSAASGKEIKYVEKTHRDSSDISVSQATKILEGIPSPQENQPYTINSPVPTESQAPQQSSSPRPSGGGINRGINTINNFARRGLKNPLGKIGQKVVAQTALRGFAAFLAGPGLPIAIAIIAVLAFTFIIVGFGGAPGAPPSQTSVQAPPAEPTLNITPTPAAP